MLCKLGMYGLVVIRSSTHESIGAERQKQGGGGKKRRQASETLRHLSQHNFGGGGYVYYWWAVVVWSPLGFVEYVPSMILEICRPAQSLNLPHF